MCEHGMRPSRSLPPPCRPCRAFRACRKGLIYKSIPYYNVRNIEKRKDWILAVARVTSKGQVTIPVRVRAALGVDAGDRIEFVEVEKGQFAIVAHTRSVRELKGLFRGKRTKPVSIEEMHAAIARRASGSR